MSDNKRDPYSYTGLVVKIGEIKTFPSGFAIRELVLVDDPDSQYPNYAVFQVSKNKSKDNTKALDLLKVGQEVTVKFFLNAFESKKNPGTYFGNNNAIEVKPTDSAPVVSRDNLMPLQPAEPQKSVMATADEIDDLPF